MIDKNLYYDIMRTSYTQLFMANIRLWAINFISAWEGQVFKEVACSTLFRKCFFQSQQLTIGSAPICDSCILSPGAMSKFCEMGSKVVVVAQPTSKS